MGRKALEGAARRDSIACEEIDAKELQVGRAMRP